MKHKKSIPVWTSDANGNAKAALPTITRQVTSVVEIDSNLIAENIKTFMTNFRPVVEMQDEKSPFQIEEIELSLVVNAKGGIELLGKLEAGAQAGIKIKLKRKNP